MPTHTIPTNSDDIIDSRDVIARIEELEEEREALTEACNEAAEAQRTADNVPDIAQFSAELEECNKALTEWDADNAAELAALRTLADEADGAADWQYGETLIRDSYFETYAQELAGDIGAIDRNAKWPLTHIDWEAAANELRMDYMPVDFDGVTYWVR